MPPTVSSHGDSVPVLEAVQGQPDDTQLNDKQQKNLELEDVVGDGGSPIMNTGSVGLAIIEQQQAIPRSGKRIPATKWEYWTFVLYFFSSNASPVGGPGGSLRQAVLTLSHPSGFMNWGGSYQPVNTVLLDINGIMTAVSVALMFTLGPYADYGSWRPWVLIISEVIIWACSLGLTGITRASQWEVANTIWIIGSLSGTVNGAFYQASYPGLVRDLPRMIKSEQETIAGLKSPEEHAELDAYERAKIFNWCNIWGSFASVVFFGIAIGISHAVGYSSTERLIRAYRILLGYYTPLIMLSTIPYFICMKWRPGQKVPAGATMWTVGPRQAWYAAKSLLQLKQVFLYLAAYVCLFEAIGAFLSVYFILLLETIHYSPELSTAFNLVGDLCGGAGCAIILFLHKRFRWKVKWIMFVSAIFSCFPCLWGALGTFTNKIGFHNVWEFWFFQVWNLCTSACSSYNVTMISEVAPASKLFMFYTLFNTVSKSTGFAGPFITAAIIKRANGNTNVAFWFLVGMCALALTLLFFIDTDKAKLDCARFAEREAQERYTDVQRQENKANVLQEENIEMSVA